MAPELFKKKNICYKSADIFACGIVLFCMVIGRPPFSKAVIENDYHF